jgi:hypothetical protein
LGSPGREEGEKHEALLGLEFLLAGPHWNL